MTQRQPIVHLREHIRHGAVILGEHFAGEAVDLVHVDAFVIAARQKEMVRIQQFEAEQCEDALHGKGATVDEITVEQIWIRWRWKTVNFKNVH